MDRRTGLTKLTVAFRNFAKAPQNWMTVNNKLWQNKEVSGCDVIFNNFFGGSGKIREHLRIFDMLVGIRTGDLSNTSFKVCTNLLGTVQELAS